MKSLREWKRPDDKSGRQEYLLLSVQRAARPKRRVLLEHRPDFPSNPIIHRSVEDDHPAESVCAASREIRTDRALNVPRSEPLGSSERRRKDRVAETVRRGTRRE